MLAIIVGLTGVGKTTVIEHATEHTNTPDFTRVSYGDVLLELAQEEGLVESRDEITEIDPEPYTKLQERVPREIASKADESLIVLDTHAALDTPTGYRPGLPQDTIQVLNPDLLVFIKATASEIQERRRTDDSRNRDILSYAALEEHQEIAKNMATTNAVLAGCPLQVLTNHDGDATKTGNALAETLNNLTTN